MLSERLKTLRKEKKITQQKLANLLGVSSGTIAMWETNKREPDFETLNRIADYFGVSTDYLLGRTSDEQPYVPVPELPNVYYRLGKEAMKRGISPEDAEKIIDIYTKFINKNIDEI